MTKFLSKKNKKLTKKSRISCVHLIYLDAKAILTDENKNLINLQNESLDLKYFSDISFSKSLSMIAL